MSKKPNFLKIIIFVAIVIILVGLVNFLTRVFSTPYLAKPIIYLYPEKETNISVKLGYEDNITVSYPEYDNGWLVTAQPNGTLKDQKTGKELYSLYYEADATRSFTLENYGFVVKKDDLIPFLEEKLLLLGLTEREANEFIIYWLPILQDNNYNYIRFLEQSEINKLMPLDVNPKPQTMIRVLMAYKGLDKPTNIQPQELVTPSRVGYTVVEWGGIKLD